MQFSTQRLPNSSDTEQPETPQRKRLRDFDNDSPSSSAGPSSPRKRARKESPRKTRKAIDLGNVLRTCAASPHNHAAIIALKDLPRDEPSAYAAVARVVESAKKAVRCRFDKQKEKLLETELYHEWLGELDYVVSAVDAALIARSPTTRKRVTGLGRVCYTILYCVMDQLISEVNDHHDGWSRPSSELAPPSSPSTMTLMEESNDPTADERSDKAVRLAEAYLKSFDRVMACAVRRYKSECGRNNSSLASRIGVQEHTLAKSCCLLCEQTGYGGDESDMGDSLMEETRDVMSGWKREYEEDEEDQLIDSDDGL